MKTIGVIGLGSIGMRHAKNLLAMGHTVYGWEADTLKLAELIKLGGFNGDGPPPYSGMDGYVIATPTQEHAEHALHLFPALVEKPIGATERDWVRLSISSRKILMVGYNLRFHGCVKKAKEWLDAGLIGEPLWANFTLGQFSEKIPYLRDGVLLNWSHELDLALYLLGPASVVGSSTHLTDGKDDIADILLTHESGCRSAVHLDYVTSPEQRYFSITGDKGRLFVNIKDRCCSLMENGKWTQNLDGGDTWNDNYIEEMQAFLDRCDGKETIGCSGLEGLEVLKICLEVRRQAGLS